MPATAGARGCSSALAPAIGVEREIAVLFCDLRGFTSLSEGRLPYDTVFILNRYFKAMGEVIEGAGGRVDKFIGDGIMALFGLESDAAAASRAALAAARGMAQALDAAQPRPRGRARRAAAHGHRPASGSSDPGRDGPRARRLADGDRRHGQRRQPARGADQGVRLHGRRLGAARRASRRCIWCRRASGASSICAGGPVALRSG